MDYLPLIIVLVAVVLIGLIWAALRLTIKRDRAAIKADMDDDRDLEAYRKSWRQQQ